MAKKKGRTVATIRVEVDVVPRVPGKVRELLKRGGAHSSVRGKKAYDRKKEKRVTE